MRVVIVGGGGIGLPTASSFTRIGNRVSGLEALISGQVSLGRLHSMTDQVTAHDEASRTLICVERLK